MHQANTQYPSLLPVAARDQSNVAHNLVSSALFTTDCISETKRNGSTPELPIELVLIVVAYALDSMRSSKDGSVIRALMHTSSFLRRHVMRAFDKVELVQNVRGDLEVSDALDAFVRNAVHLYLIDTLAGDNEIDALFSKSSEPLVATAETCSMNLLSKIIVRNNQTINLHEHVSTWYPDEEEEIAETYANMPTVHDTEELLTDNLLMINQLASTDTWWRAVNDTLGPPWRSARVVVTMYLYAAEEEDSTIDRFRECTFHTVSA